MTIGQMSLDQTLNQKLSIIDREFSSASSPSQDGHSLKCLSLSPHPPTSPVPTSPSGHSGDESSSKDKKISFGKVTTENRISNRDDDKSALTSTTTNNLATSNHHNHHHQSQNKNSSGGGPTSPNMSSSHKNRHSSAGSTGSEKDKSVRVTRKVFNTWRSVCGKKTKDLFKRWKTLPEHDTVFDDGESSFTPPGTPNSAGDQPSSISKITKMLVKKHSEAEIPSSVDETLQKASAGWSVHVWATYVQRGSCEDEENSEELQPGRDLLSDFQKVKLTHFFRHVLDMNHDDVISAADFVALNQRIRHYIEWSSECIEFHILKEVHSGFLECFLNQPLDDCSVMYYCNSDKETRDHVNLNEWLDVWGNLLKSVRVLEALPLWLQYFPKILFQVINKSGSGTISREELRAFYTMFLGIDFRVVNETLDSVYNAMTDKGAHKMTYGLFKLCFANFLFAKHPHGPGQYLFGICSPDSLNCAFPIDYSALNTPKDDLEPYNPETDKDHSNRRSVIV